MDESMKELFVTLGKATLEYMMEYQVGSETAYNVVSQTFVEKLAEKLLEEYEETDLLQGDPGSEIRDLEPAEKDVPV